VCGRASLTLHIDTSRATLRDLLTKVAKGALGVSKAYIDSADTDLIYEEGSDVEEDMAEVYARNLEKTLEKLPGKGLKSNSVVSIQDEFQHFSVHVTLVHRDEKEFDEKTHPLGFILEGEVPQRKEEAAAAAAGGAAPEDEDEDDDFIIIEDGSGAGAAAAAAAGGKRKASEGEDGAAAGASGGKKARPAAEDDDDIVVA
jgi:hypothetical protein